MLQFWGLEMPTKGACQLDGATPGGSLSKELQANVPSFYSEKAKLWGMWWQTRTGVRTSKLPKFGLSWLVTWDVFTAASSSAPVMEQFWSTFCLLTHTVMSL